MDRLTTGLMIAAAALLMTGGLGTDVFAREASAPAITQQTTLQPAPQTATSRIMSLLLTLDALRTAPTVLEPKKV